MWRLVLAVIVCTFILATLVVASDVLTYRELQCKLRKTS